MHHRSAAHLHSWIPVDRQQKYEPCFVEVAIITCTHRVTADYSKLAMYAIKFKKIIIPRL